MKIMLIAGARPNFMKIASIIDAIDSQNQRADHPIHYLLVYTGQHYDGPMSQAFFEDLALPQPHVDLEVGSSSHAVQTAEIMKRFEPVLLRERPDVVIVVGDVNSTIACSLVASKISYQPTSSQQQLRPLVAHVEGGLRSFDRSMPEEINRILTDTISDSIFVTEESAVENLSREGIPREKIHLVGNTMVDTLLKHKEKSQGSNILARLGIRTGCNNLSEAKNQGAEAVSYALITLHRPSNVDNSETFREILEALSTVAEKIPVIFPVHPRTMNRIKKFQLEKYFAFITQEEKLETGRPCINCIEPLGYLDFLCLMSNAKLVLTDSGGIQEETTVLGIPCLTLRQNTERPITITHGTNVLVGTKKEDIIRHALDKINQQPKPKKPRFWDGNAGQRIVKELVGQFRMVNEQ